MPRPPSTTAAPYSTKELVPIRAMLQARRDELIEQQRGQDREMADTEGRDPPVEEEEAAAHQHDRFVASRVRDTTYVELQMIDRSIAQIDTGSYGLCDDCDEPIAIERLRALPYTRLCAADASRREREHATSPRGLSL